MFNDNLLEDFIHKFFGYGNFKGKYWFIGMEEGGGDSFTDINRRLKSWDYRGKLELEDVADYHFSIGIPDHFKDPVKLQRTWNKLIRILLAAEGIEIKLDDVREYQKSYLGRLNVDSCLIELLPLPSPSTGSWLYSQYSRIPYLKSRKLYSQTCIPFRSIHIKEMLDHNEPKAVIFYSFSYKDYWQDILGFNFVSMNNGEYYMRQESNTLYIISMHPAAKGVSNDYFENLGRIISKS
jgi:hypothetical protein